MLLFTWVGRGWVKNNVKVKTSSGHSLKGNCALVDFLLDTPPPPNFEFSLWKPKKQPLLFLDKKRRSNYYETQSVPCSITKDYFPGKSTLTKHFWNYETLVQLGKETWYPVQTLRRYFEKGVKKCIVNGGQVFEKTDLKLFSQERK